MRDRLREGVIEVWAASLQELRAALPAVEAMLSPGERERASRFVSASARDEFMLCRAGLRHLASIYLDEEPAALKLELSVHGKPFLSGVHASALQFNVSHSDGLALLAFGWGRPVGVDVEHATGRHDDAGTVAMVMSSAERSHLDSLPAAARTQAFYTIWTVKEAVLKSGGDHLSDAVRDITVEIEQAGGVRVLGAGSVTARTLEVRPGWAAAVAAPGPGLDASLRSLGHCPGGPS